MFGPQTSECGHRPDVIPQENSISCSGMETQSNFALNSELLNRMKEEFYKNLYIQDLKSNSVLLTKDHYNSIIQDIKRIKHSKKKESSRDYRRIDRYDVMIIEGCERLIEPLTKDQKSVKTFIHAEEVFDILYFTHLEIGHGGRDRMLKKLRLQYKNITQAQIKLFLKLCEPCQKKHNSEKRLLYGMPGSASTFNSTFQVEFIDNQSKPDGKFKFIMICQDNPTKFMILKPLSSMQVDEVAENLLHIFLLLGAPSILQLDCGPEFANEVLDTMRNMWSEIKRVQGKPMQGQGSEKDQIIAMLSNWMLANSSDKWSEALGFVQFEKNSVYHMKLERSPYEAMFGR